MRLKNLFLCFSVFMFFDFLAGSLCSLSYADAVYLKNGKVMTGKIVEKNTQFLILRSGEGPEAVKSTIFLEDILKIITEEQYSQEEPAIVSSLKNTEIFKKANQGESFYSKTRPSKEGRAADIRRLIQEDQRLQAAGVSQEDEQDDRSIGEEVVRDVAEQKEERPEEELAPVITIVKPSESSGSIGGVVRLPQEVFGKKKGPLYVYLFKKEGSRGFGAGDRLHYTKINSEGIYDQKVPYAITGLSSGTYMVFALWDVAEPLVEERTVGNGVFLVNAGLRGDYLGTTAQPAVLAVGEKKDDVNFDCSTYLAKDGILIDQPEIQEQAEILDIYYNRTPEGGAKFSADVKNIYHGEISKISFYVLINDEDAMEKAVDFGSLAQDEIKTLDLTPVYEAYKRRVVNRSGNEAFVPKMLKFRMEWSENRNISFEKTIFAL